MLAITGYSDHDKRASAIEYAPDGLFAPVDLEEWSQTGSALPQGWGTADRLVRLEGLLAERGPVPARAAYARELAERTGMRLSDAAWGVYGHLPTSDQRVRDAVDPEVAGLYLDPATGTRAAPPRFLRALSERLMPDAPEDLWSTGPSIDRAVHWWKGSF